MRKREVQVGMQVQHRITKKYLGTVSSIGRGILGLEGVQDRALAHWTEVEPFTNQGETNVD